MKTMTIKIEEDLLNQLKDVAEREERSVSNTARMAIRAGIERFFLNEVTKHPDSEAA